MKRLLHFWLLPISRPFFNICCENCCNSYNLVKKIGCYGDKKIRALPLFKQLSRASTTAEFLENVRRCRDEVEQKGGLAAGFKVYLILSGIISHGQID